MPSRKTPGSITDRWFPFRSRVSSIGRPVKASKGRLAMELSARTRVWRVFSRPRQLSPDMSVISFPGNNMVRFKSPFRATKDEGDLKIASGMNEVKIGINFVSL